MRLGSLFSGYGGLDRAAERLFGAKTVWHCEWEEAPSKILAHHWPTVPNFRDVTQIVWEEMPPIDLLTGGYPCQPFSASGLRLGVNDERHLWPYVRKAIRVLRPRYTLLENVAGHRSLGFDRVLGDLAEDGMDVRWTSLRASDIGAPHHRERLFILVTPSDDHSIGRGQSAGQPGAGESEESADLSGVAVLPEPEGFGFVGRRDASEQARGAHAAVDRCGADIQWGTYAPAVRRWERLTRPAPAPTEPNSNGRPRLNAAFAEWMMGLPSGHVTDPEIGISRAHQLKAIGNGVCPQQATAAYASLLTTEAAA